MKYELAFDEQQIFTCKGSYFYIDKMKIDAKDWYLTNKRLVLADVPTWAALLTIFSYFMKGTVIKREIDLSKVTKIDKEKKGLGKVFAIHTPSEKFLVNFTKEQEMIEKLKGAIANASGKKVSVQNDCIEFV